MVAVIIAVLVTLSSYVSGFSHYPGAYIAPITNNHYGGTLMEKIRGSTVLLLSAIDEPDDDDALPNPNDMRLSEIKVELSDLNISYGDCFDKESMMKRLIDAREGVVAPQSPPAEKVTKEVVVEKEIPPPTASEAKDKDEQQKVVAKTTESTGGEEFDREATLSELRSLRVKELKENLSKFGVRWGTMIEKEDMVTALCKAMEERFEQSKNFSRSGDLIPGTITDVEESVLIQELGWLESDVNRGIATTASAETPTSSHPPILLDVYATWCGPCQLVAPMLKEAATELGPTVRVVKLDSDKYPRLSSVLKGKLFILYIRTPCWLATLTL